MKKYILLLISFIFCLVSCSKKDIQGDDSNNFNVPIVEFILNGIKQNTNLETSTVPLQYDNGGTYGKPELSVSITFKGNGDDSEVFICTFNGLKFEDMKVGDDLVKLCDYSYMITYDNDIYELSKDDTEKDDFRGYGGSVIIKELDLNKRILKVELKNITIPILKDFSPSNFKKLNCEGLVKDIILFH